MSKVGILFKLFLQVLTVYPHCQNMQQALMWEQAINSDFILGAS